MSFIKKFAYSAATVALLAAAPAAVYAQQTTASVRGTITDASGAPVGGASVTITHLPTASVAQTAASANGAFNQANLRVGGPYRVVVQADGFEPAILEGISLNAGSSSPLRVTLAAAGATEIITVRGERLDSISLDNGIGSAFTAAEIDAQPSFSRDFTDVLARDPLVTSFGNGELSIAGVGRNFNTLSLDGIEIGEQFGIASSGAFPSQRPPIDLDSIESVSVTVADFSVLNNGFQGGNINVVTRSGTNEFDGVIGYYMTDADLVGDRAFGNDYDAGNFEEEEISVNVGGPIIEDTLFFFVSYSDFERVSPSTPRLGDTDIALFDAIRGLTQSVYNYDPGDKRLADDSETTERLTLKFDWNINDNHRATLTYLELQEDQIGSFGSFDFPTAARQVPLNTEQVSVELISDWNDNFSTLLRVGQKETQQRRTPIGEAGGPAGSSFASILIEDIDPNDPWFAANGLDGNALVGSSPVDVRLGPDRFDQANAIDDELFTLYFQGDYTLDDHTVTFGMRYEDYSVLNVFVPGSAGVATFDGITDFANGDVDEYFVDLPGSGNIADGITEYSYELWAFFAQDTWTITPDFEINYGVRYERLSQDDLPPARLDVTLESGVTRTFQELYGVSGRDNLDGVDILLPRAGFNWSVNDRLTLRGGFGLFSGGSPAVFLANSYVPLTFRGNADGISNFDGSVIPQVALDEIALNAANANGRFVPAFGVFDPNFEIPAQWRASLVAEYALDLDRWGLGDDYNITAQYVRSQAHNQLRFVNLAWETDEIGRTGIAPDGRPIYPNLNELEYGAPIMLTNSDEGSADIFAVSVAKDYDNGFGFDVSYAYSDVEDAQPYTSSRAVSNFRGGMGPDRQNIAAHRSINEVEHSFNIFLQYERDFYKEYTSSFSLFGTIQSGSPFGYGMRSFDQLFGVASDGEFPYGNNDNLYVPVINSAGTGFNDPIATFANPGVEADLLEFVQTRGLEGYQGGWTPTYVDSAPWTQRWDFAFEQELPGIGYLNEWVGDNNFKFTMDVFNVMNLLNDDWGTRVQGPGFGGETVARVNLVDTATGNTIEGTATDPVCGVDTTCVYEYQFLETDADGSELFFENDAASVWQIRFGLRYEF
ncbi:TonB-dependent receptor [Maricaulis sp.]|uniref:TonB-dependent receptor n=1 Tax=Maricaulis sp. TaxID=1486257 RepID=UPI0026051A9F|nr:TonB-dependent receptor [Maricaulis sp.]